MSNTLFPPVHPRFPRDPPRGKGIRVSEGFGIAATAAIPVLTIVQRYRKEHELLHGTRSNVPERTRSLRTPRSNLDRSPRAIIQRSWASLRGVGHTLSRSGGGSGDLVGGGDGTPSSQGGGNSGQVALSGDFNA